MSHSLKNTSTDDLFRAIGSLQSLEEFYSFFEDLCTVTEIKSLSHRFAVAKLLSEGKTYHEVIELTGASTATISRINKCLEYGADGYGLVIARSKSDNE